MNQSIRILHLEDNATDAELVEAVLESAGMACRTTRVQTCEEFREALCQSEYDIILADYSLPMYDGISALRLVQELGLDVPFIFVSGTMGEDAAVEGLTKGATDYVLKQRLSRLVSAIKRALHEAEDRRERKRAEDALRQSEREKTILNRILGVFLTVSDEEVYGGVLSVVLDAMESRFGVFGFIADNGDLVLPSLTRGVWGECQVTDKSIIFQPDTWGASLWGRAIREKRAFYSHGPFQTPQGHIHIDAFLTAPIVYGKEAIGLISVANKERGYTDADKDLFESIANNISPVLNARLQRDREEHRRRQAEEALHKNEAKLKSILGTAPTGIGVAIDEVILDANESLCDMTGYSRQELLHCSARLLYPTEEEYHWVDRDHHRRISEQGAGAVETRWRRRDGTVINVLLSSAPLDPRDISAGFTFTALDITGRKLAENIMQARLRLLEFAGSHSMDELLTATLDEIEALTGSSIGFYHFLDPDQETLSLQSWSTNTLKNMCTAAGKGSHYDVAQAGAWVDCLHERGPVIHNDYASLPHRKGMPEGHAPVVREVVVPIFRGNLIKAIIGVGNKAADYDQSDIEIVSQIGDLSWDIVESKLAEQKLKESLKREQFLGDIIRSASVGIKIGHPDGAIVPLNTAMIDITGYSAEELKAIDWSNLITPPEWRENEQACLADLERTGKPVTYEKEYIRKEGSRVPVQLVVHGIFDADGRLEQYIAFVTDITSRKAAEDEHRRFEAKIRQAQKMEAIGTLAGGIAHDFNNILSAIIGYTEMAINKTPGESIPYSYMQQVLKGAARAADLVKQILTFSRQTEEEHRPVLMDPIIKEALKLLRASLPTTIEIRPKITTSSHHMVIADPTQIHQVIMNLCANAAHAMREHGGILEVELSEVELSELHRALPLQLGPGAYLRLKVSDTGHGMNEETLQRIFDPFFTTKPRDEGTGMGLAVVHGIVENYGGAITVQSKPGEGSQFCLFFPLAVSAAPEYRAESKDAPAGKGCILFVDDEEPLVEVGRAVLEGLGYRVVTRTSSLEALEVFRSGPDQFDLVVTDLTMPRMTGVDLAKQIRQIRADTPIILCTGYTELLDGQSIAELGFQELVYKPILRHIMAQAIDRSLRPKKAPLRH